MTALVAIIKALAELVKAFAWPAAALGLAWVLRAEIKNLIKRIRKLEAGWFELKRMRI